jgi:hypothetical protein
MDTLVSAKIKDNILKYLLDRYNKKESLEAAIKYLKLEDMPHAIIRSYVDEMANDGTLDCLPISNDRLILTLSTYGERLLIADGGYVSRYNVSFSLQQQQDADAALARKASRVKIRHTKLATWLSAIAIIVSIIAILISIFKD